MPDFPSDPNYPSIATMRERSRIERADELIIRLAEDRLLEKLIGALYLEDDVHTDVSETWEEGVAYLAKIYPEIMNTPEGDGLAEMAIFKRFVDDWPVTTEVPNA